MRRARWTQKAAALLVAGTVVGALVATPVFAAAPVTKKTVRQLIKKIAYTKKQANAMFLNAAEGDAAYVGRLFAEVGATGTLVQGVGVTEVSRILAGSYLVKFAEDVSKCAFVASPHGTAIDEITASTALNPGVGNNAVNVFTRDAGGGGSVDVGFSLIVVC